MRTFFVYLFLSIPLCYIACETTSKEDQIYNLKTEVFAIHDEVMPLIENTMLDMVDSLKVIPQDSKFYEESRVVMEQLNVGIKGMDDWMVEFEHKDMEEGAEDDAVLEYFESEKVRISKVKDDMLLGIKSAEKLFQEIKKEQ